MIPDCRGRYTLLQHARRGVCLAVLPGLVLLAVSALTPPASADVPPPVTMGPCVTYYAGLTYPRGIATADFTGDGHLDLIAVDDDRAMVLAGDGEGAFAAHLGTGLPEPQTAILVGDFDADGNADAAIDGFKAVYCLFGDGAGSFSVVTINWGGPDPEETHGLLLEDLNADGFDDLAFGCTKYDGSAFVRVYLSNADGTFQAPSDYVVNWIPEGLAAGDLDRDGDRDIAVACASGSVAEVDILTNEGDGTFSAGSILTGGWRLPSSIAIADMTGDGAPDISVGDIYQDPWYPGRWFEHAAFIINNGDGTFHSPINFNTGGWGEPASRPLNIVLVDLNGDRLPENCVLRMYVFAYNNVIGTSQPDGAGGWTGGPAFWPPGTNGTWLTAGDFNGDGLNDLATPVCDGTTYAGRVAVFLNTTVPLTPTSTTTYDFASDATSEWHNTPQTVTLTASGHVAPLTIHYSIDGGLTWATSMGDTADVIVSAEGSNHFFYYASDVNGAEPVRDAGYVNIDTQTPSTSATASNARVGGIATLEFTVNDPLPSCGAAHVTIEVLWARRVVATIPAGILPANTPLTYDYASALKRGTYTYRVLATDVAGNVAADIGSAKLRIK